MPLIIRRKRWKRRERRPQMEMRKIQLSESNYTYADLAEAAGVTFSMVTKWMRGERKSRHIAAAFKKLVDP